MLDRLFSLYKSKKNKPPEPPEPTEGSMDSMEELSGVLDNPFMRILIEVGEGGDFSLGFDSKDLSTEQISLVATTMYMLNNGMLDSFFIEALQLWSEGNPVKQNIAKKIVLKWDSIDKRVTAEYDSEENEPPAIEPFDVFKFT